MDIEDVLIEGIRQLYKGTVVGDLSFLTVYATGAPIKAIGGTRSDARTQAMAPADGLAVIYVVPHFAARETHQRRPDQPGRSDDVRSSG